MSKASSCGAGAHSPGETIAKIDPEDLEKNAAALAFDGVHPRRAGVSLRGSALLADVPEDAVGQGLGGWRQDVEVVRARNLDDLDRSVPSERVEHFEHGGVSVLPLQDEGRRRDLVEVLPRRPDLELAIGQGFRQASLGPVHHGMRHGAEGEHLSEPVGGLCDKQCHRPAGAVPSQIDAVGIDVGATRQELCGSNDVVDLASKALGAGGGVDRRLRRLDSGYSVCSTGRVSRYLQEGEALVLAVAAGDNAQGDVQLDIVQETEDTSCVDEDLLGAVGAGVVTAQTTDDDDDFDLSCGMNASPDHSMAWTAPQSGTFVFDTGSSSSDTVLAISGPACAVNAEVSCNDDDFYNEVSQSLVAQDVQAGEQLIVTVEGYDGTVTFDLDITRNETPGGTCCETAESGGCDVEAVESCVCDLAAFCCDDAWGEVCVDVAKAVCDADCSA